MKQKILSLCFLILAGVFAQVQAQIVAVKSLDTFSTEKPPSTISVELLEPLEFDSKFQAGTVINGKLVDVVRPRKLKRNASFKFSPLYYIDNNGERSDFTLAIEASFTQPLDTKKLAKNTALTVGNFFVSGVKATAAAVEGAVKNEQGNRLKSAGTSVYEASPISLVQKGHDIYVEKNQLFYLKFNYDFDNNINTVKE